MLNYLKYIKEMQDLEDLQYQKDLYYIDHIKILKNLQLDLFDQSKLKLLFALVQMDIFEKIISLDNLIFKFHRFGLIFHKL